MHITQQRLQRSHGARRDHIDHWNLIQCFNSHRQNGHWRAGCCGDGLEELRFLLDRFHQRHMGAGQPGLLQPIGDGKAGEARPRTQIGPSGGLGCELVDLPGIQRVAEPEILQRGPAHQIGVGVGLGEHVSPALEPGDCFT